MLLLFIVIIRSGVKDEDNRVTHVWKGLLIRASK